MTARPRMHAVRIVSASVAAVAASLAFPFLIHLLPAAEGVQLGSMLLPIFWAPLLAAVAFGSIPAVTAAALAPLVNNLLTGLPPDPVVFTITLELLAFVAVALLLLRRWPRSPLVGPAAYLAATVLVTAAFWAFGGASGGAWTSLAGSLWAAFPGIAVLMLLNVAVLSLKKEEPGG